MQQGIENNFPPQRDATPLQSWYPQSYQSGRTPSRYYPYVFMILKKLNWKLSNAVYNCTTYCTCVFQLPQHVALVKLARLARLQVWMKLGAWKRLRVPALYCVLCTCQILPSQVPLTGHFYTSFAHNYLQSIKMKQGGMFNYIYLLESFEQVWTFIVIHRKDDVSVIRDEGRCD